MREIALPTQLPPLTFTHNFGRFNDSFGVENNQFEVVYLNKELEQNYYSIRIKPVKYKLEFTEEKIAQSLNLNNGSEAIFSTWIDGFNILVFENNNWQYVLSVDKKNSEAVTKEVLVEIANSIK